MSTDSPKEKVLAWVRSKNPQTHDYRCGGCGHWKCSGERAKCPFYLGSDMGLQELLIAFGKRIVGKDKIEIDDLLCIAVDNRGLMFQLPKDGMTQGIQYDLTKNLHNQDPTFYESILPLISNE